MDKTFRTLYPPHRCASLTLDFETPLLLLGSCFAQDVGQKLVDGGFLASVNPLGIEYNPVSISQALSLNEVKAEDLVRSQDAWHHMLLHSHFSAADPEQAVAKIMEGIEVKNHLLEQDPIKIVTLGTAWAYYDLKGSIVGNCHKLPESNFNRRLLSIGEIYEALEEISPNIITVSPIRHLKDGFSGNMRSKARLLTAAHDYCDTHPHAVYFPSYEIMMDDLRDYRFYAQDMIHPSTQAVDYIFEAFLDTFCSLTTKQQVYQNIKISHQTHHRAIII